MGTMKQRHRRNYFSILGILINGETVDTPLPYTLTDEWILYKTLTGRYCPNSFMTDRIETGLRSDLVGFGLLGAFLLTFGLGAVMYTESYWRHRYRWDVVGGEPTDWSLFTIKLGGVILMAFAYILQFIVFYNAMNNQAGWW